jgi:AcrR family transcriptional regulator
VDKNLKTDDMAAEQPARRRIIEAALAVFSDKGYENASTLEIATRAKVSKREIYANFSDKQNMLVACMESRAVKMNLTAALPRSGSATELEGNLAAFGSRLLSEVSAPTVIAVFRIAIAEATRSPVIAQSLNRAGRLSTYRALTQFLTQAQSDGFLADGNPQQLATEFLALLWEGLWVDLLLGVVATPSRRAIDGQAKRAVQSFMALHGKRSRRG